MASVFNDKDCSSEVVLNWEALCTASKYLHKSRIRNILSEQTSWQASSNSLLPHTNASLSVHQYVFEDNKEYHGLDYDSCSVFSKAEKKVLGLRSILLLPSYCVAPWDAMKSYFKLLQRSCNMDEEESSNAAILSRRSIGDVRLFVSSICNDGGGNDHDCRTIHAQQNEIILLVRKLAKQLYSTKDQNVCSAEIHEFEEFLYDLIVPLFKATLRTDFCLQKVSQACKVVTDQSESELTLSDRFLGMLIRSIGCPGTLEYINPSRLPSVLSFAHDLKNELKLLHWSNLQSLTLHSFQRCGLDGRSFQIGTIKGTIVTIMSHIASNSGDDESILNRWIEIFLLVYYISSTKHGGQQDVDQIIYKFLPKIQDDILGHICSAVVTGYRSSGETINGNITSNECVPNEVRAKMILLLFYSKCTHATVSIHNYDAKVLLVSGNCVKNNIIDVVMESMVALIISSKSDDADETRQNLDIHLDPIESFRLLMSRHRVIEVNKLIFSLSKMSMLRQTFEKCVRLVKSSFMVGAKSKLCSDKILFLDQGCQWRRFAVLCVDKTAVTDEIHKIVISGAILISCFDCDPSSRKKIVQDIVDTLCKFSREDEGKNDDGRFVYCWILHVLISRYHKMGTITGEENSRRSLRFPLFAFIYQMIERNCNLLPRKVNIEILRSVMYYSEGRRELSRYCLQDIKKGLQLNHGDQYLQRGLDGIFLLLRHDSISGKSFDVGVLNALSFISDELVRKEHVMSKTQRLELLSRLLLACTKSQIHHASVGKILNATLISIMPYFSKRQRTIDEIEFVPCHALCIENKKGTVQQEELLLLVHLILVSLQNISRDWHLTISDEIIHNVFEDVTSEITVPGNSKPASYLTAISCVRALIKYFSNQDLENMHHCTEEGGEVLVFACEGLYQAIHREETIFWAQATADGDETNTSKSPNWIKYAPSDLNTRPNSSNGMKQLPHPILSSLSALLLNQLFVPCLKNLHSSPIDVEMKRTLSISIAANTLLHATYVSRTQNHHFANYFIFVADVEYSVVTVFLSSTSKVFSICDSNTLQEDFMDLVLPATLEICSQIDAILLSDNRKNASSIFEIYESMINFYCICSDWKGNGAGSTFSAEGNLNPLAIEIMQELRIVILRSLHELLKWLPINKDPLVPDLVTTFTHRRKVSAHFRLLVQLSKDLNMSLRANSKEAKQHGLSYMHIISELVSNLCQLIRSTSNFVELTKAQETSSDWEESVVSSSNFLWDALQYFSPKSKILFKAIILIVTSRISELSRLLSNLKFFNHNLHGQRTSLQNIFRNPSLLTVAFALCAHDTVNKSLNMIQHTSQCSYLSRDDEPLNEWTLSLCLDNFERIWKETNRNISGAASKQSNICSPEKVSFGTVAKAYVSSILPDLRSTLSSSIILQTECAELSPLINQKLCMSIEKVIITLVNAVNSVSRYCKNTEKGMIHNSIGMTNTIVLEASACLVAWLRPFSSEVVTLSKQSDFISVCKSWYELGREMKDSENKFIEVSIRIADFDKSLINFSKEMKRLKSIDDDNDSFSHMINLFSYVEQGNFDLMDMIDKYLSTIRVSANCSKSLKAGSIESQSKNLNMKGRTNKLNARSVQMRNRKKRYRNSVVNEWFELDQEIDDKNDNNGYHELEDFILPG